MNKIKELTKINSDLFSLLIKATGVSGVHLLEADFKETPLIYINGDFEMNTYDIISMYSLIINNMNIGYAYCVDEYEDYKNSELYYLLSEIKKKLNYVISEVKEWAKTHSFFIFFY